MLPVNRHPPLSDLRWFAALQLVFFAGVVLLHRQGLHTLPSLLLCTSAVVAALGLWRPLWVRKIYVGWMLAVFPIGWLVGTAVLTAIYYLVFTPIGLLLRATGRDPLGRRFDRAATTYWSARPSAADKARYFRQF
jgi:ABC-type uncharacterized transport system permease subunit